MNAMDILRRVVYNTIEDMYLEFLDVYCKEQGKDLRLLLEQGAITEQGLDAALTKAAVEKGKRDYHFLTHSPREPFADDSAIFPEYLIFAFDRGAITRADMEGLKYDHGDTVDSYCSEMRRADLVQHLRKNLLKEESTLERVSRGSGGGCETGCCECWESH